MTKFVFLDPAKPVAVWWPCPVEVPVDSKDAGESGGQRETQTLNLRLVALSDDASLKLMAEGYGAFLDKAVAGWDAVDEAGKLVPFERFPDIAAIPYVRDAVLKAYRDFIGRAASKN